MFPHTAWFEAVCGCFLSVIKALTGGEFMAVSAKKISACRALAESGDPEAQKTLGTYYAEGNGVEQ
ncbi:MAG: hypothetical protein IJG25_07065, partial [Thermoguttaceae bacterium]|nr:hypothetical protein [Thermoguttaceae bacterium]